MNAIAAGMKDIENDFKKKKKTLAIKMGVRVTKEKLIVPATFKTLAYSIQLVDILIVFLPFFIVWKVTELSQLQYIQWGIIIPIKIILKKQDFVLDQGFGNQSDGILYLTNQHHPENNGGKNQIEFFFNEINDKHYGHTYPESDHRCHPFGFQGVAGFGPLRPGIRSGLCRYIRFSAAGADLGFWRQFVSTVRAGCREF